MKTSFIILLFSLILVGGCFSVGQRKQIEQSTIGTAPLDKVNKILWYENISSLRWLVAIGVIGVGLSVAGFINGQTKSLGFLVGSIVMIGTCLAILKFGWAAALLTFGGGIIAVLVSLFAPQRGVSLSVKSLFGKDKE